MKNILLFFVLSLVIFGAVSCSGDGNTENGPGITISGHVEFMDEYGQPHPSFLPPAMFALGFSHGDIVRVEIGKDISMVVPFTTGINEIGMYENCLCNYNNNPEDLSVNMMGGCFAERIGSQVGDTIIITLVEKGGYLDRYELLHSVYDTIYSNYGTPERFANFREIRTSGMAHGVLFRSSNPLNPKSNPARCTYADQLAEAVGIKTEIDLADTPEKIQTYSERPDFKSPYCLNLVKNDQTIALGLNGDTFSPAFMQKFAEGLRFMISHEPPYLVHCNEGKDRCGFVSMLLEALAGATYQEITDDYLTTFYNFYGVEKGSESYELRRMLAIDRVIWMTENYSKVGKYDTINWDDISPSTVNYQQAAHDYIIACGLSEGECQALYQRLVTPISN